MGRKKYSTMGFFFAKQNKQTQKPYKNKSSHIFQERYEKERRQIGGKEEK